MLAPLARTALIACAALLATLLPIDHAHAQGGDIVINEVVADNKSELDNFGATPDWIELRNEGAASVNLAGWTLSDTDGNWVLPSVNIAPGARLLIWASDRNLAGPPLHANFRLSSQGETVRIACLLYTSPSPRDGLLSRMPSSA